MFRWLRLQVWALWQSLVRRVFIMFGGDVCTYCEAKAWSNVKAIKQGWELRIRAGEYTCMICPSCLPRHEEHTPSSLRTTFLNCMQNDEILAGTTFPDVDLSGLDLSNLDLSGCNLAGANFLRTNLGESNLRSTNLQGATLERTNLQGANLYGADLYGANLRVANLQGANLSRAHLEKADFRGALLKGADFRGASLRGADLRTDLNGVNLEGVVLEGVSMVVNSPKKTQWDHLLEEED